MIHLTIDGQNISVPKGTSVYEAAQQLGIDIPIFCYFNRMPAFGACRVCLVEVESMAKLQASCTLEATEGMVVKTQSALAADGRKDILELLLINHPLDCPVCDRGGECPLQDQTLKFGPGESRFYEDKRRFKKPLSLTPILTLDRERCIVCARCTRFSDLIAGDHALEFFDRGYKTEVGTAKQKQADPKFLGNTIMICPVGALTSTVYRFRARPWDNKATETTCPLCPIGCSMVLDSRDGEIMRTRSSENPQINDIWLCDKGWFGYEFVSHPERLKQPLLRQDGKLIPTSWENAFAFMANKIKSAAPQGKLAAFGGNNLTIEECYLLQKLMRKGMSVDHVDHRIGMPLHNLQDEALGPGMEIPVGSCRDLDYAIMLGIDLTEEFPLLWLHLKLAQQRGTQLKFIGHYAPEIASHLSEVILHAPGQELETLKQQHSSLIKLLSTGKKGALFVGRQYLATTERKDILAYLLELKRSYPELSLNLLEGEGNSMGARFAGMHPELLPAGQRLDKPGMNAIEVLRAASQTGWDFLYVVGADPAAKYPSNLWQQARDKLQCLVVQELFMTKTAECADLVLPALCFAEKSGKFANIEGRIQQFRPGKEISNGLYSDAEIFTTVAFQLGLDLYCDESFLLHLQQVRLPLDRTTTLPATKIPPPSTNNNLAASFAPALFDHGNRMLHNKHLSKQSVCRGVRLHPSEASKRGLKNGNVARISINGSSIMATLHCDEAVAHGTLVLPLGFEQVPTQELGPNLLNGLEVSLE